MTTFNLDYLLRGPVTLGPKAPTDESVGVGGVGWGGVGCWGGSGQHKPACNARSIPASLPTSSFFCLALILGLQVP